MYRSSRLVLSVFCLLVLNACGGGGGSSAPPVAPPCAAAAKVCYVSPTGNDLNTGADPAHALASIRKAAEIALNDYEIIVAPGSYRGEVTTTSTGTTPQRLRFTAQGQVIVDVTNIAGAAGFTLSNSDGTVIDGFTVVGGADGGIVIKSASDNLEIRNCTIRQSGSDGIRIQDSRGVLIFNNLIYGNAGIGLRIGGTLSGSPNTEIISNTIYGNGGRGIEIGTTRAASPSATVLNNIVQDNSDRLESIKVETNPRSDVGYSGDYNLVFPAIYIPNAIRGDNDVAVDAEFLNPPSDFRLSTTSPAIDAGSLLSSVALRNFLRSRTTTGLSDDSGALDIGYHFP